jgi:hypothetical protein
MLSEISKKIKSFDSKLMIADKSVRVSDTETLMKPLRSRAHWHYLLQVDNIGSFRILLHITRIPLLTTFNPRQRIQNVYDLKEDQLINVYSLFPAK